MYIKLKNWRLTNMKPGKGRAYILKGSLFGIPVCIRNVRKVEYIRVGIIVRWGCISFLCVYGLGSQS